MSPQDSETEKFEAFLPGGPQPPDDHENATEGPCEARLTIQNLSTVDLGIRG